MKGISPIVSTILMVAIAIAAAVVVYYITMNVVTQQGTQLEQQATAGYERIVIDAVQPIDSNTTTPGIEDLNVYVRNIGDAPATVTALYVYNADGTLAATVTGLNVTVNPGQVGTVSVTGVNLAENSTFTAEVRTANGAVAQKVFNT